MPWLVLLTDLRFWLAAALVATGLYAAVQRIGWQSCKAEYAQFRADVESEAAKAKVKAAQDEARHAQHAQEVLDDLQTRLASADARYASLRSSSGSRPMPPVPETAAKPSPSPVGTVQPNPDPGCLAAFEWADRELAKFAELWRLQEKNSANHL